MKKMIVFAVLGGMIFASSAVLAGATGDQLVDWENGDFESCKTWLVYGAGREMTQDAYNRLGRNQTPLEYCKVKCNSYPRPENEASYGPPYTTGKRNFQDDQRYYKEKCQTCCADAAEKAQAARSEMDDIQQEWVDALENARDNLGCGDVVVGTNFMTLKLKPMADEKTLEDYRERLPHLPVRSFCKEQCGGTKAQKTECQKRCNHCFPK